MRSWTERLIRKIFWWVRGVVVVWELLCRRFAVEEVSRMHADGIRSTDLVKLWGLLSTRSVGRAIGMDIEADSVWESPLSELTSG
jgi:hypothetical protein